MNWHNQLHSGGGSILGGGDDLWAIGGGDGQAASGMTQVHMKVWRFESVKVWMLVEGTVRWQAVLHRYNTHESMKVWKCESWWRGQSRKWPHTHKHNRYVYLLCLWVYIPFSVLKVLPFGDYFKSGQVLRQNSTSGEWRWSEGPALNEARYGHCAMQVQLLKSRCF